MLDVCEQLTSLRMRHAERTTGMSTPSVHQGEWGVMPYPFQWCVDIYHSVWRHSTP